MRQRPHRRRLARPAMAHDQNSANQGIDEIEYQGQFHLFLANDGGKRVGHAALLSCATVLAENLRLRKRAVCEYGKHNCVDIQRDEPLCSATNIPLTGLAIPRPIAPCECSYATKAANVRRSGYPSTYKPEVFYEKDLLTLRGRVCPGCCWSSPFTPAAAARCASTETPSAFRLGPRVVAALTTLAARGPARTGRPKNRIVRRAVTKSC